MGKEIKVTIQGKISDYNIQLYNERLAIVLLKELGADQCKELVELFKNDKELIS